MPAREELRLDQFAMKLSAPCQRHHIDEDVYGGDEVRRRPPKKKCENRQTRTADARMHLDGVAIVIEPDVSASPAILLLYIQVGDGLVAPAPVPPNDSAVAVSDPPPPPSLPAPACTVLIITGQPA